MTILARLLLLLLPAAATAAPPASIRVAVGGSEPFVVKGNPEPNGIAVEVWRELAARAGWTYALSSYQNVPSAFAALSEGKADIVVGPVSITAERVKSARFSQPYFQASLSILSRSGTPSVWERIRPFFSSSFFTAVGLLLIVLFLVGTCVWLAERRIPDSHFPSNPVHGIGSGVWFAIVTMSTVGYGDFSPKTAFGRLVTGIWIIISIVAASSLVAGIASTLTLTGLQSTQIAAAEDLSGRPVAALADSPGARFVERYGGVLLNVSNLDEGYRLLSQRAADAFVFDRPQLLHFLRAQPDPKVAVSAAEYGRQNYGFALPLDSPFIHALNINLLELQESGRIDRIVASWLGTAVH
ncbi:MAG: transporter substrate-binding domain-containing protein [Bryobacteraceae bacterium]